MYGTPYRLINPMPLFTYTVYVLSAAAGGHEAEFLGSAALLAAPSTCLGIVI
jgi:hypothetical protein